MLLLSRPPAMRVSPVAYGIPGVQRGWSVTTPSHDVCMSLCLSAGMSLELRFQSSPMFLCVAYIRGSARSSSGDVVIRYERPVLWTTSRLDIMVGYRRREKAYFQSDSTGAAQMCYRSVYSN